MQDHAVIHTGEKPFKCTQCDKRFNNKANLNKHRRIHTNQRPYVCNICGQTYRQNYDLKRHMTRHTGKKQFECEKCGRCFARKSYLKRHMSTHGQEQHESQHECQVCHRRFHQQKNLDSHMMKVHQSADMVTTKTSSPTTSTISNNTVSVKNESGDSETETSTSTVVTTTNVSLNDIYKDKAIRKKNQEEDIVANPSKKIRLNSKDSKDERNTQPTTTETTKIDGSNSTTSVADDNVAHTYKNISLPIASTAVGNNSNKTIVIGTTSVSTETTSLPTVKTVLPLKNTILPTINTVVKKTLNTHSKRLEGESFSTAMDVDFLTEKVVKTNTVDIIGIVKQNNISKDQRLKEKCLKKEKKIAMVEDTNSEI